MQKEEADVQSGNAQTVNVDKVGGGPSLWPLPMLPPRCQLLRCHQARRPLPELGQGQHRTEP